MNETAGYPEHEKLQAVKDKSQAIGEFIEWLQSTKHYVIAQWQQIDPDTEPGEAEAEDQMLFRASFSIETLLAEYFKIDLGKLEQEKQAMLESLRQLNQKDADAQQILAEVKDHAAFWHSDMAKRCTVEKHLAQKGMPDVEAKVNELIKTGKLSLIPKPKGDYIKEVKAK